MKIKKMQRKVRAFVFLKVEPRKEEEIMEKLLKLDEVKEIHIITGKKDLLAVLAVEREIVTPNSQRIANFIINEISSVKGVLDTQTIIPTHSKIKLPE
jgi:DNA-binding Lrp family transcriptional regulator